VIDMLSGLPVLDVDFNDVREDDTVVICRATSFNQRTRGLRRGALVQLWDGASGSCLGRVARVRGRRVDVITHWDTWQPAAVVTPELVWIDPVLAVSPSPSVRSHLEPRLFVV
jgi:hypothetical protein